MRHLIFLATLITSLAFGQTQNKTAEMNKIDGIIYTSNIVLNTDFEKNVTLGITDTNDGLQLCNDLRVLEGNCSYLADNNTVGNVVKIATRAIASKDRNLQGQNCSATLVYNFAPVSNVSALFKAYVENSSGQKISSDYIMTATVPDVSLTVKPTYTPQMMFICPSDSTAVNIVVETIATSTGGNLTLDLPSGGLANFGSVPLTGPKTGFTPVTQGLGTITLNTSEYILDAGKLHIWYKFVTGTTTAAEGRIGLPTPFIASTASGAIQVGPPMIFSATSSSIYMPIVSNGLNYINFSNPSAASGFTAQNGNIISSTTTISMYVVVPIQGGSNVATIGDATLPSSWSGTHSGSDCAFARTNTAYGDPTADASCTFTERVNNNFGTVSSVAGLLPGITITPKKTGTYYICASISMFGGTSGVTMSAQLIDNSSTTIAQNSATTSSGTQAQPMMLCGITNVSSISALTYKVQTKVTSGTVTIGITQSIAVEWNIFPISTGLPMAFINGLPKSFQVSTTAVVSNAVGGDAVTGCTTGATGIYTCTPTGYASKINCSCTPVGGATTTDTTCSWETMSTSTLKYRTTVTNALANSAVSIICHGE